MNDTIGIAANISPPTITSPPALGTAARLAFFLHIPFPAPDIFMRLPWRKPLIEALLQYDLVGFQTTRDRRNFIACVKALCGEVRIAGDAYDWTLNDAPA